ncbi:aspartate kinase [Brevibacillus sp. B_LB10_24]|uniref:aspartate kinase n=1 Tax=Brevibacillus sp. B_LB10_24 TaxID=3380645 RepID=UPI0038B6F1E6
MALIVQKYGGTSVGSIDRIRKVAKRVMDKRNAGHQLVVVLSAMGKTTDELVKLAKEISPHPDERDLDMLVSTGEQVSIALLSMALQREGCRAVALTGWQAGILTDCCHGDARIRHFENNRICGHLQEGKVVIVAGFQGVDEHGEITTLGRGGSDTSAVALAASLGAERCEIYTDVTGVFTADPRLVPTAQKLSAISYQDMLDLAQLGAGVLHPRSVETARKRHVRLVVRSSFSDEEGTYVGADVPAQAESVARGIAHQEQISILWVKGREIHRRTPMLTGNLREAGVMANAVLHGTDLLSFPVATEQHKKAAAFLQEQQESLGFDEMEAEHGFAMVSLVGVSRHASSKVPKTIKRKMKALQVPIRWFHQSERKVSIALPAEQVKTAVRALHRELGLDAGEKLAVK